MCVHDVCAVASGQLCGVSHLLPPLRGVPVTFFCYDKQHHQKQLEGGKSLFQLPFLHSSPSEGSQGRNSRPEKEVGTGAEAMREHYLLACFQILFLAYSQFCGTA